MWCSNSFLENKYSFSNEKVNDISHKAMKEIAEEINNCVKEKQKEREKKECENQTNNK